VGERGAATEPLLDDENFDISSYMIDGVPT